MKIAEALKKILLSPNGSSREPIFETYDKNVQGNTVWERGKTASSVVAPFRDMSELPEKLSRIGVAVATGGNPFLAKISARLSAEHAVAESLVKVSCIGGEPLALTDCLNFGNPEKSEQMGQFVDGVEGVRHACESLNIPIVSGNVSFYNESGGKSIPPSALVSLFARVENSAKVPVLGFQNPNETIFLVGPRSENLGGSALLEIAEKKDSRAIEIDFDRLKKWTEKLRHVANMNVISMAHPIGYGGMITALAKACFACDIGAELKIQSEKELEIVSFLFSEDPGAIIATTYPEKIKEIFGDDAIEIGTTKKEFSLCVSHEGEVFLDQELKELQEKWSGALREII